MIDLVKEQMRLIVEQSSYQRAIELFDRVDGGKYLRAKLVLLIAKQTPKAIRLAAIIELIHTASLLHDDVIDESTLRRGQISVNATEGSKVAVMMGDILYSKAFSALTEFDMRIAKIVADAVTTLSIGEMMDVEMAKTFCVDEEQYMQMLYCKTGVLIEAAAKCAAYLSGGDVVKHGEYGKGLGVSFQIIDDILDITQTESTLGKPSMGDFAEGKTTLPYIYLYDSLELDEAKRLKSLHATKALLSDTEWIREQMYKHGAIEKTYQKAASIGEDAIAAIAGDRELEAIVRSMMERSY